MDGIERGGVIMMALELVHGVGRLDVKARSYTWHRGKC